MLSSIAQVTNFFFNTLTLLYLVSNVFKNNLWTTESLRKRERHRKWKSLIKIAENEFFFSNSYF